MVVAMVLIFNILWAPYAWLSLAVIIKPGSVPKWLVIFPTMFGKLFSHFPILTAEIRVHSCSDHFHEKNDMGKTVSGEILQF